MRFLSPYRWLVVVSFLALTSNLRADEAQTKPVTPGLRVFTCGNSFHAWYIAPILKDVAEKAGIKGHEIVGVSKIGGSRTIQHWDVAEEKNQAKAALREGRVDVLTLAGMHHPDEGIDRFVELGIAKNPAMRITIQQFWMPWDKAEWPFRGKEADVNFDAATSESLQALHAPYFSELEAYVLKVNSNAGRQVLYLAPVGQAVVALRERIIAGQMPGFSKQSELFTDKLGHPHAPIEALATYVHFAMLYQRTPVGLPIPKVLADSKNPQWRSEELNRALQDLAWAAVTAQPLSGVKAP